MSVPNIAPIEQELLSRVLERFTLPVDTLLFDATNFFTFIAPTNTRATLAARGYNKQQRDDLRQVGVALARGCASRLLWVPDRARRS